MRKKLAGLSLIIAFAAAVFVSWAAPAPFTIQAQVTGKVAPGISTYELQQKIDVKGLPVQETADLI
jgi:hypothetical protein